MYMASLMALVIPCASLPTMEKLSTLMWSPEVLLWAYMGRGPWDDPWTYSQSLCWFAFVVLFTPSMGTLKPIDYPTFWVTLSLSSGVTRRFLMVLPPLKCSWTHTLQHICINEPNLSWNTKQETTNQGKPLITKLMHYEPKQVIKLLIMTHIKSCWDITRQSKRNLLWSTKMRHYKVKQSITNKCIIK